MYSNQRQKLADLTAEITDYLLDAFGIKTKRYLSSELKVPGKKDELILNLCRELGATVYLSGPLGRNYLREDMFRARNIAVRYHDYHHPAYSQVYPGFEPFMAAVDLLFNAGPRSLEIMTKNQELIAQ
jgi:hypothetical protein